VNLYRKILKEKEDDRSEFLSYSLWIVSQTHIWHWMTRNGQEHESIGEFYTGLQEGIDNVAERIIGKYGLNETGIYNHKITYTYDIQIVLQTIIDYDSKIDNIIGSFDKISDSSIIDSLVDIKELIDKLKYKFRLS